MNRQTMAVPCACYKTLKYARDIHVDRVPLFVDRMRIISLVAFLTILTFIT